MSVCTNCHRDAPDGALFCAFCGSSIKRVGDGGAAADPLIGVTVGGKYLIHQLLGRGGMGDVYKATHLTLDRPVVLKLLKKVFQSDQSLVQRFHREARAASRLNHPNSITIIDFGQTDDGTLFMAMEYLAGRTLERVIAQEHPLAEARVVHMGAQILAALSEAHALGIIHRDLKPANVMIESRLDEKDFVKVLDFGIAKLNGPGKGGTGITQAGIVCGTPGYMSPEQVTGQKLDARSDLYGVGVILYEMITGLLPFESQTPMGLVTKHLVEDPLPIAVRNPRVSASPALDAVIMRALARNREERFRSSGEMRAALLSCPLGAGGGQPVRSPSRPPSTLVFDPVQPPGGEAAKPDGRPGADGGGIPLADQSEADAAAKPADDIPGSPEASRADTAPPAPTSLRDGGEAAAEASDASAPEAGGSSPDVLASGAEAAPTSRRRAPIIGGAIAAAVAIAAVASWGLASGRFGKSAGAPLGAATPDPDVAARPSGASSTVASAAQAPPDAQAKPPESAAVAEEPAPPVPEPTPRPGVPRKAKPQSGQAQTKKGVKQVRQQLNSIRTPPVSSGEGVLTVLASPWAMVSIDGRDIGETPREVRLGTGRYRVRATHPVLGVRERVISVKPGKRQIWNPSFGK